MFMTVLQALTLTAILVASIIWIIKLRLDMQA
jgi:hypothetical protein